MNVPGVGASGRGGHAFKGQPGKGQPPKGQPPKRVRVTSPRSTARRRAPARPLAVEVVEETRLGEVYVDSLIRSQFRLSLAVLVGLAVLVVGLPVLLTFIPDVEQLTLGPVPLVWLFLGVLLYPFAVFVAWLYIRSAERLEHDFATLMEES